MGVILVVAGWFTGRNHSGTIVRTTVAEGLETLGSRLAEERVRRVGLWVSSNAAWLRIVSGLLGVVVFLWGNQTSPSRLAWSTALVVLLLIVIQILVGAGRTPASTAPAPPVEAAA